MAKYSEAASSGRMDKNAEGYADPTAGAAYNNIRREEKLRDAEAMEVISHLIPVMKVADGQRKLKLVFQPGFLQHI